MRDDEPVDFWAEFRADWVKRLLLVLSLFSALFGRAVEPGLRGLAAHQTFERLATLSSLLSNALAIGLLVVLGAAVNEMSRRREISPWVRWLAFGLGMAAFTLMVGAVSSRAPKGFFSLPLAVVAMAGLLASGLESLRFPHSRGIGIVFLVLSVSVLLRVVAYRLASHDERAIDYFGAARAVALVALLFEALATLLAAVWLFARTRGARVLLALALLASGITAAVYTGDAGTPVQSVLRALSSDVTLYDATLGRLSVGLGVFAFLLAAISACQSTPVILLSATLGLALIGRGATDAPLRALVSMTASLWLLLSARDPRVLRLLFTKTKSQPPSPPSSALSDPKLSSARGAVPGPSEAQPFSK